MAIARDDFNLNDSADDLRIYHTQSPQNLKSCKRNVHRNVTSYITETISINKTKVINKHKEEK
jgi:hypothetical protein